MATDERGRGDDAADRAPTAVRPAPPWAADRDEHTAVPAATPSDATAARTGRWTRVEHAAVRPSFEIKRHAGDSLAAPSAGVDVALVVPQAARSSARRTAAPLDVAGVEQAMTARLERQVVRQVSATVEDAIGTGAELYRTLTDHVYDGLYERLVLEKERLG